jgi:hypothetical protein
MGSRLRGYDESSLGQQEHSKSTVKEQEQTTRANHKNKSKPQEQTTRANHMNEVTKEKQGANHKGLQNRRTFGLRGQESSCC